MIPAYLFSIIEGWSYLDAWYFTVVSLTTIGFGDYAPSFITDSGFLSVYRMMALCWLLIGLAWLGGLLSLMTTLFGEIQNSIFVGPIKLKAGILEISVSEDFVVWYKGYPITLHHGDPIDTAAFLNMTEDTLNKGRL